MDLEEIPLPPGRQKSQPLKTRKECNAEDQQKAEDTCARLRQKCIAFMKTPDLWKPCRENPKTILRFTFDEPLPNNFVTSIAFAKLRTDFRENYWVIRHNVSSNDKPIFQLYPVV
mgnify:CR=1 FL=1